MNNRPPTSKRRYLTGIDWTIGCLDRLCRNATGIGNLSQVILELEGSPDPVRLADTLANVSARLPILHGHVTRHPLNLAPYWSVPKASAQRSIPLRIADLAEERSASADALFAEHVNTPLEDDTQHIRLLLVRNRNGCSRLGMVFDHRLLDAAGAELFLELLDQDWRGNLEEVAPQICQSEPAHLNEWTRQFRGGKVVNRFGLEWSGKDIAALPLPSSSAAPCPRPMRFVHDCLTRQQAGDFANRAADECGLPAILPSALARAAAAMRPLLLQSPLRGSHCLVAVSVDARNPSQRWEQLLFNHLAFLGFCTALDPASSPGALVHAFRDQLFEQMKAGLPQALQDAAMLTRICPQWAGARLVSYPFKGRVCSFYFACLQKEAFCSDTFMGLNVRNLVHTPRIPPPPGIGFCVTFFRGRANLVLSYLDGLLDDAAARELLHHFRQLLAAST